MCVVARCSDYSYDAVVFSSHAYRILIGRSISRCCIFLLTNAGSVEPVFGLLSPIEQLDPLDMFSAGIKRLQKLYKLM
ncbi:unnamed protein product [Schistosoma bovis]|nr:unnamed protein product [Schistosoma bovis]